MAESEHISLRGFFLSRSGLVLLGFLAIAGYFLWTEHEAHLKALIPYSPFLLLLLLPLMHLFMHHGHGGHEDTDGPRDGDPPTERGRPSPSKHLHMGFGRLS